MTIQNAHPGVDRTSRTDIQPSGTERTDVFGWLAAGGLLGAVAASSCCLLPLALFGLGVGGAWMSNLTALAPYQPIFLAITAAFLGTGFWLNRRSQKACEGACERSMPNRLVRGALWLAVILAVAAVVVPYATAWTLGA